MIGALNPAAVIAAQLAGPQRPQSAPDQSFVWGRGGSRMTPEDIARERERAAAMMQTDYSPIASPWQGLARVAENITGALRERSADKAATANAERSDRIAQLLTNSGGSSSQGLPGAGQSQAPGGSDTSTLLRIMSDPYVSPQVKAVAQSQYEMQQKTALKQFEFANREPPEIVRLSQIANDPSQPEYVRSAAQDRITALNDPTMVIPGLPSGTYVGPRSQIGIALGGAPEMSAPDTLPPDFEGFDTAPSASAAPQAPTSAQAASSILGFDTGGNVVSPQEYQMLVAAMGGEAAAQAYLRRQGLSVGGR